MPATGCAATQSCQPKPAAPFGSGTCIHQTGDVACPAGAFSTKHVFYAAVDDLRRCSPCICGNASAGACPVSGGTPTGAATPTMPTTFCCMP